MKTSPKCKDCGKPLTRRTAYFRGRTTPRPYSRCKKCYNRWTYQSFGKGYRKGPGRDNQVARERTRDAIAAGRIRKPSRCEKCNLKLPSKKIEAHHEDHTKTFVVRFLCRPCHRMADAVRRSG